MTNSDLILGTLKPDGTLELDHNPKVAPGRVQVTVQPLPAQAPFGMGLAEVIHRIRLSRAARGTVGPSQANDQQEEQLRQEEDKHYDQRIETIWSQTQTGKP